MEQGNIMSEELIQKAKECLADTFVMYMKAHAYHWNVVGPNFPQYHDFLGKLYEELHGSIDDLAEQIRALDSFAPASLSRMVELSKIKEDTKIVDVSVMFNNLLDANEKVIETLTETYELAEKEKAYAYSNFLQDRLTVHAKHNWMLKSIINKKQG
jgi:starvation-inducible DNA-binding protein